MNENTRSTYRTWLKIFAIVFLLGLVQIFGLRAAISTINRHPETLPLFLRALIQSGLFTISNAVLGIAAIILLIRTTLKKSTYRLWLLVMAVAFLAHFGLGLIAGIQGVKVLLRWGFAHHEVDYFIFIFNGIIILIYGGLAVAAYILSRRFKTIS